jgi:hypothetical protein
MILFTNQYFNGTNSLSQIILLNPTYENNQTNYSYHSFNIISRL